MELLQLMEDVYFDLNLEHRSDRENPVYAGWLDVFEVWANSPAVSRRLEGRRSGLQSDLPGISSRALPRTTRLQLLTWFDLPACYSRGR